MKIVRPYMRMLTSGHVMPIIPKHIPNEEEPLEFVNWCGRISHRSEDAERQDVERFLRSIVLQHGDWSITEHVNISVDAVVDRGITHELVRHRLGAYTQESTRFVNYLNKMPPSFIWPVDSDDCLECRFCLDGREVQRYGNHWLHVLPEHDADEDGEPCAYDSDWLEAIDFLENKYKKLVRPIKDGGKGWRPQRARSVFPNALASRIVITYNLRMWRHFFLMRTTAEAHPQMRQVTIPLLEEFKKTIPVLYEDIEPNAKQSENLKKAR